MVRVVVREVRGKWYVRVGGSCEATRPTRREAEAVARQKARERPERPAVEIETRPGTWRTVAP